MQRVVITGATSMIGVALIDECIKNNVQVLAIVRKGSLNKKRIPISPLVEVIECDLKDLKNINIDSQQYDTFFHVAWDCTMKKYRNNLYRQLDNVSYTLDAVELAHRLQCKTFIGTGSQAEYGRVKGIICPESPVNPETAYGIAKYSAFKSSVLLCQEYGMKHIWTRIFSVYGPYDNSQTMIMYAITKLLKKEKPVFTKSEQLWDYLYSSDAGNALYLIGEKGKDKSIYCIASGIVKPLYEYIYQIRDSIDKDLSIGIGEIEYSEKQVMNLRANIDSLVKDTGFKPKISFKRGIELITKSLIEK